MVINTKTDLIKEIEAFSKALYDYSEIGDEIILYSKFNPYYSELGILKREDYSDAILDEEAFLVFYSLFFDKITLNPNAEQVSDSKYFNTLYQTYRDKNKKELENLDLFMQVIKNAKQKEAIARSKNDKKEHNSVELFLQDMLINKIRKQIKSKSNSEKFLVTLMKKIKGNRDDRHTTIVIGTPLMILAGVMAKIFGLNAFAAIPFALACLLLIVYSLLYLFMYRITKQEKEELNQLPENFKKYLLGNRVTFKEEFFNDKTTSYLDPLLKDSEIYKYVKAKYIKTESGNGIVYE